MDGPSRLVTAWLSGLVTAMFGVLIAACLGLLPLGHWQDEYWQFSRLRERSVWTRLWRRSPRPVSEAILYVYALAVEWLQRPLIAEVLAVLWLLLLASCFATLGFSRREARAEGLEPVRYKALLGSSLLAMFLIGHPVGEMFYWPVGAAAYLTTLAALCALLFLLLDGAIARTGGRALACVTLLLAAASAEVGAVAVLAFSSLVALFQRRRRAGEADANDPPSAQPCGGSCPS